MSQQYRQTDRSLPNGEHAYRVREAVGVFMSEKQLVDAVDRLEAAGIDRAEISVLAPSEANGEEIATRLGSAVETSDDAQAPRGAFISHDSLTELKAAAVGLPTYVGSIGGLFAVAAAGGGLALALGVGIAGALAGGGLGLVAATALSRRHREKIAGLVARGGIVLWVRTTDAGRERIAETVLDAAGARHVHVHDIDLKWGIEEMPLAHAQPDPLLERQMV